MLTHLFAFTYTAILTFIHNAISIERTNERLDQLEAYDISQLRLLYAEILTLFLSIPGYFIVMITMIKMFLNHAKPLTNSKKLSIAKKFMLVFADNDQLTELNNERLNLQSEKMMKDKMAKKLKVYRQLADAQIQEVIATMMSISAHESNRS